MNKKFLKFVKLISPKNSLGHQKVLHKPKFQPENSFDCSAKVGMNKNKPNRLA